MEERTFGLVDVKFVDHTIIARETIDSCTIEEDEKHFVYTVDHLRSGQAYLFSVEASNALGSSGFSEKCKRYKTLQATIPSTLATVHSV